MSFESNTIARARLTLTRTKIKLWLRNKFNPTDLDVVWFTLNQARDMKMIPAKAKINNAWLKNNLVGHSIRFVFA